MAAIQFRRILVAVDGSDNSKKAGRVAVEMAKRSSGELEVLHVVPRLTYDFTPTALTRAAVPPTAYGLLYSEARKEAENFVGEIVSAAQQQGVSAKAVVLEDKSSVVEAIIDYATDQKVDLVITGTRGRSGFSKMLLGSVSNGIVAHAQCSVLIVR